MDGFTRKNQLLSLCGLNCGLCPMHLGGYCPGCGGGPGNQSCRIAKCSLEHGAVEYCCDCPDYPCPRYDGIDQFDSFITHRRRKADLQRVKVLGTPGYIAEQREKIEMLNLLLARFNDGRRKTFYCVAVNLLDLPDLKNIMGQIADNTQLEGLPPKERAAYVVGLFQQAALQKGIEIKLRRKK